MSETERFEYSVDARLEELQRVRAFVDRTGATLGLNAKTLGDLRLIVDEAVTNIIVHGYGDQSGRVTILMEIDGGAVVVRIRDNARPFEADAVPRPHLEESLEKRAPGGMGIHLIRKLSDEAVFKSGPGGNELRIVKRLG